MRKLFIVLILVLLATAAYAARNVTPPMYETFEGDWCTPSDLQWTSAPASGGGVSKVQESWRGGGNYCARIDPPRVCVAGGGTNGGTEALGAFLLNTTYQTFQAAFAVNVGTTYNSSSGDCGGSMINKFLDIFGPGDRAGLLAINDRGSGYHEFGIADANTEQYWYYPNSIDANAAGVFFGNGTGGGDDKGGKWLWVNYIVDNTTGQVTLRITDREGIWTGAYLQRSNATNIGVNELKTLGGYYNEYHPTADTNSRILIDDLYISTSTTPIAPPTGFVGGTTPDTTPNAFTFTDVTGATRSTVYTSNTITVAGIDASTSVSITGGTYSKNGRAYTSAAGTAVLGDTFAVRVTSSASYSTAVNAVLNIGGVSDTYTVTTLADTVPAFLDNLSPSGVLACTSNPRNVTLSLTTDETATARMSPTDTTYALMSDTFTTTGGTSHSEVKSLACGASYTYYVRTRDSASNDNPTSSTISFSIASPQIAGPGGLRIIGGKLGGN